MKRILYYFFFAVLPVAQVWAQTQQDSTRLDPVKPSVQVIARSYGDSVVLRWAPTISSAWTWCNKYGYIVERYTIVKDGKFLEGTERIKTPLGGGTVKPAPLLSWENLVKRDKNAAIYAQALYGTEFIPKEGEKMDLISMASRAEQNETRFSFALFVADQSVETAALAGLKFTDTNLKKGERYLYRVYPSTQPKSYRIDTGAVFVNPEEQTELPKPFGLEAEFGDKSVNLSWSTRYYDDLYISYLIERSEDGGKTYTLLDDLPFINITPETKTKPSDYIFRLDSLPENGKMYHFRVKGKTPFGETSPPSEEVSGSGIEQLLAVEPVVNYCKPQVNGAIEVRWLYPDSLLKDIQGFVVARAKLSDPKNYKDLTKLLAPTRRSYEDMKPEREAYYVIKAVDINGKVALSFPIMGLLKDSIPPLPPIGLIAKVDSAGIVKLKWKRNKEEDMYGYRVFMSNNLKEEFMLISHGATQDTFYTDTISLHTLTKKAYYKLVAIDQHFNPSAFSEVVELKRPDVVPPGAPVLSNMESLPEGIMVRWKPSTSSDVLTHVVYRRKPGDTKWITVAVVDTSKRVSEFLDKGVEKRKTYEYTVIAVDDSRLESEMASPIEINYIDDGKRPDIVKFKAALDSENKKIDLKWEYELKNVQRFLIYKAENGGQLRLYKSVEGTQYKYTDKTLYPNTTYRYRVKAVLSDGAQSNYSKELTVVY